MTYHWVFQGGPIRDGGGNPLFAKDDGMWRQPLSPIECEQIHRDPEVPHPNAPAAFTRWLDMDALFYLDGCATPGPHMRKAKLEVGDSIVAAVYPDAIMYVGTYLLNMDPVPGLEGEVELLSADDVGIALEANPNDDLTGVPRRAAGITIDFAQGLGDAIIDAKGKADNMPGTTWKDYRNQSALSAVTYAQPGYVAPVGSPVYYCIKITALPATANCQDEPIKLPTIQFGLLGHDLGLNLQTVRKPWWVENNNRTIDFL